MVTSAGSQDKRKKTVKQIADTVSILCYTQQLITSLKKERQTFHLPPQMKGICGLTVEGHRWLYGNTNNAIKQQKDDYHDQGSYNAFNNNRLYQGGKFPPSNNGADGTEEERPPNPPNPGGSSLMKIPPQSGCSYANKRKY